MSYRITEADRKHVFTIEDLHFNVVHDDSTTHPQFIINLMDGDKVLFPIKLPYFELNYREKINELSFSSFNSESNNIYGSKIFTGWDDEIVGDFNSEQYLSGIRLHRFNYVEDNPENYDEFGKLKDPIAPVTFGEINLEKLTKLDVSGTLDVQGNVTFNGDDLYISGNFDQKADLQTTAHFNETTIRKTLNVNETATFNSGVQIDKNLNVNDSITTASGNFDDVKINNSFNISEVIKYNNSEDKELMIDVPIMAEEDVTNYFKNLNVETLKVGSIDIASAGQVPGISEIKDELDVALVTISGLTVNKGLTVTGLYKEIEEQEDPNNPGQLINVEVEKITKTDINGNLDISGITNISGTLNIQQELQLTNGLRITENNVIIDDSELYTSGNITIKGNKALKLENGAYISGEENGIESYLQELKVNKLTIISELQGEVNSNIDVSSIFTEKLEISGSIEPVTYLDNTDQNNPIEVKQDLIINTNISGKNVEFVRGYFSDDLNVSGKFIVESSVTFNNEFDLAENITISGNANISGELNVSGTTRIENELTVTSGLYLEKTLNVSELSTIKDIDINGTAYLSGSEYISGTLEISEEIYTKSNANISGNITLPEDKYVSGGIFSGVSGTFTDIFTENLNLSGNLTLFNGIDFNNPKDDISKNDINDLNPSNHIITDGIYHLSVKKENDDINNNLYWIKNTEYQEPSQILFEKYITDDIEEIITPGIILKSEKYLNENFIIDYSSPLNSFDDPSSLIIDNINKEYKVKKPYYLRFKCYNDFYCRFYSLNIYKNYTIDLSFTNDKGIGDNHHYGYIIIDSNEQSTYTKNLDDLIMRKYFDGTFKNIKNKIRYHLPRVHNIAYDIDPSNTLVITPAATTNDTFKLIAIDEGMGDRLGKTDFIKEFTLTIIDKATNSGADYDNLN